MLHCSIDPTPEATGSLVGSSARSPIGGSGAGQPDEIRGAVP
ncbi:hypothetical protein [Azospirillum argentinense]